MFLLHECSFDPLTKSAVHMYVVRINNVRPATHLLTIMIVSYIVNSLPLFDSNFATIASH